MKRNPAVMIAIGAVVLLIGLVLNFTGSAPKADSTMAQQCRDRLTSQKAEPSEIAQCSQAAFATAMTATDAQAAAQAISAANNSEIGGSMLAKFLLGAGLVLLIAGIAAKRKRPATDWK